MKDLTFKLLEYNDFPINYAKKAAKKSMWFSIFIIPLIIIIILILIYIYNLLFFKILLIFCFILPFLRGSILIYYRKLSPDWNISKFVVGNITFSIKGVFLSKNKPKEINITDVLKIDIKKGYYKGYYVEEEIDYGTDIHNGISNMKITLKDNSFFEIKYIIENSEDFYHYKRILETWRAYNIDIQEDNYYIGG